MAKQSHCLVVSHDAGGAEVVSSWVKHNPQFHYQFLLDGPAISVFKTKLNPDNILSPENLSLELVRNFDRVLVSTGWGSDIEKKAIQFAKNEDVLCMAYLDHWSNYRARFELNGSTVLPDEIWAADEKAYTLAKHTFPQTKIVYHENPYYLDIRDEFKRIKSTWRRTSEDFTVLYVCESIGEGGRRLPSGKWIEFEAMSLFLNELKRIFVTQNIQVYLRLHPAEKADKYLRFCKQHDNINIQMSTGKTLVEDCLNADWIVGMNSMALIIATLADKEVFYCNIDKAAPNNLPSENMKNLFDQTSL